MVEDIPFTLWECVGIDFCKLHRGDNGMVIRYIFVVKQPGNFRRQCFALHKGKFFAKNHNDLFCRFSHIVRQETAVRSGIG